MDSEKNVKLVMLIDAGKCFDCKACMMACKVSYELPKGYWRNWVKHNGGEYGLRTAYQPGQCMQCDNPTCVAACPVGATWKGPDGVVVIDTGKCIGCGNCVAACPYDARFRNPFTKLAEKCDFCASRRAGGSPPACVETCPTKARVFGNINDPESEVARLAREGKWVKVIAPQFDTGPNLYYREGTPLLGWARAPRLPGGRHMPVEFWSRG